MPFFELGRLRVSVIPRPLGGAAQPRQRLNRVSGFLLRHPQVVDRLQVQPKPRACMKEMPEPQRGVAGDRALAIENFRNPVRRHLELATELGRAHIERLKLLGEMLARMNCAPCLARARVIPIHDGYSLSVYAFDPTIRSKSFMMSNK